MSDFAMNEWLLEAKSRNAAFMALVMWGFEQRPEMRVFFPGMGQEDLSMDLRVFRCVWR